MMKQLRYLTIVAALALPSVAFAQPGPTSLCTPIYNATTGAESCVNVGQPSPGITATNSLPTKELPYTYTALGYQQITAGTLASATALTVPTGATIAEVCVDTAPVRYRDDGTAPTASVGMPAAAGTCFAYSGALAAIQFILASGSPVLNVSYYR
jgi:hypothetical protein